TVIVNGKEFQAPIHVVNKSELVELSAVLFGRDGETEITSLNQETRMLVLNSKGNPPTPAPTPEPEPTPTPTPAPSGHVGNQQPQSPVPPEVPNQQPLPSQGIGMVEYAELAAKYPSYL